VTPEQSDALRNTLTLCNEAADIASALGFDRGVTGVRSLQRLTYKTVKAVGLSAQPAIHVIQKVAGAYAALDANIKAGNLGRPGSKRFTAAISKPVTFRADAAQSFDDRSLSWNMDTKAISIWTVAGRIKDIPFGGAPEHLAVLATHRRGQSVLVTHRGNWYLHAVVDIDTPAVAEPNGFIGVDLGIVNIASTSTGQNFSGAAVNQVRHKNLRLRQKLQRKGTQSARRLLRKRSRREARFITDTNHVIAKKIVTEAKRTGKGIAVENLTGIRSRVRLRKPQRVALNSWAFAQLGGFLAYKAEAAGVAFVRINPAYTSQECSECHQIDKKSRIDQATFICQSCGVSLNADINASRNTAYRGAASWGALNLPNAGRTSHPVVTGTASQPLKRPVVDSVAG